MKIAYWILIVVLGLIICFFSACFLLPSEPEVAYPKLEDIGSIDDIVQPYMDLEETRALSIAVVKDTVVKYYNYGSISKENEAPPTEKSIYEIGSISKVFTGILLADMVVKGEVGLEDNISDYLPDTLPRWEGDLKISLKELATHTARIPRLPRNLRKVTPDRENPYKNYDTEALYGYLSTFKPKKKEKRKFVYSNLGFGILGHILAEKGGVSYENLIKTRLTDTLGMIHTGVTFADEEMVQGHDLYGQKASFWDLNELAGAGGLRSTTEDMAKFIMANIKGSPSLDLAQKAHAEEGRQGLGWVIYAKEDGKTMHWHNGGTGGFRTFTGMLKDKKIGVVVLSNTAIGVDQIGSLILKKTLQDMEG